MWSATLFYQKDPASSRFVAGGLAEAEQLLGSPLPPLPPPDREAGRNIFAVRFHPQLRTLLLRFLQGLLSQIGTEGTAPPERAGRDLPRDQAEYEDALERLLHSVRATDRRLGLLNLCWLALTRDVAESLRELEAKSPAIKKGKYSILVRETERRLREGDRGLLARMARHMPELPKEHWQTPAGAAKVMMNSHVLPYLLADAWTTGARLMASARIKAEAERRRPAEIIDAFLDLISGVKRFEILAHVRDQVVLHGPFGASLEDRVSKGMRLYEFGDSATVLNSAV